MFCIGLAWVIVAALLILSAYIIIEQIKSCAMVRLRLKKEETRCLRLKLRLGAEAYKKTVIERLRRLQKAMRAVRKQKKAEAKKLRRKRGNFKD